jgi:hypothetical protein
VQFESANFSPSIIESINQLDALILNGDYYLDETQRQAIGDLLERWSRVHDLHVISAQDLQATGEL